MACDDDCRVWVGNLSDKVNDEVLYELFLQAGPIEEVLLPKENGRSLSYGYVTFKHQCSVPYSLKLFKETFLYGKEVRVKPKRRDMPRQYNELHSQNQLRGFGGDPGLRGFGGDPGLRGRGNLLNPYGGGNSDLFPKEKINTTKPRNDLLPNVSDFAELLKMTQQLQNPYGSLSGPLAPGSPSIYPSQALDPVMRNRGDESSRHRQQNDFQRLGSPLMYPSQALDPIMKNRRDDSCRNRQQNDSHHLGLPLMYPNQASEPEMKNRGDDSGRQRYQNDYHRDRRERDRYDKSHPYHDYKRDNFRHGNSSSRYNQSSRSHRRERK